MIITIGNLTIDYGYDPHEPATFHSPEIPEEFRLYSVVEGGVDVTDHYTPEYIMSLLILNS